MIHLTKAAKTKHAKAMFETVDQLNQLGADAHLRADRCASTEAAKELRAQAERIMKRSASIEKRALDLQRKLLRA